MVLCKHDRDGFWDLSESGRKPKGGIIIQKTKMDRDAVRTLANHEKRVEEARKFNLLSNVFMSVALNDIPACQYVLDPDRDRGPGCEGGAVSVSDF